MIDDLDMNAGYDSEHDYGDEYIDLDGMTDGLNLKDNGGLFIKQHGNLNDIADKYAKYDHDSDNEFD